MNKAIVFLFGAAGGVVGSSWYWKRKYKSVADQQIQEMEEYYQRTDEYARKEREEERELGRQPEELREEGNLSDEKRKEIKEKLKRNREFGQQRTNYAAIYAGKNNNTDTEESMEDAEEEDQEPEPSDEEKEHDQNINREPELVTLEAVNRLDNYWDHECLTYNGLMVEVTDEDGEVVDDPYRLFGPLFSRFDQIFEEEDYGTIFILNYAQDTCYEVMYVNEDHAE